MTYTKKFQELADDACTHVEGVLPEEIDALLAQGAIALDIRDKEEHDADHIEGSINISRGKLEMNVEHEIENLNTVILCYCDSVNRGALSANALRKMGYVNAKYINGGFCEYRRLVLAKRHKTHSLWLAQA